MYPYFPPSIVLKLMAQFFNHAKDFTDRIKYCKYRIGRDIGLTGESSSQSIKLRLCLQGTKTF